MSSMTLSRVVFQMFVVEIPWPRYPTVTPTGKESKAKKAGMLLPWLSTNVVNNTPHPLYRSLVTRWRDQSCRSADGLRGKLGERPYMVTIALYKRTAKVMDPWAVLEGAKPIIDGIADAAGMDDRWFLQGRGETAKDSGNPRVVVMIREC